jgi:hypothetical protein
MALHSLLGDMIAPEDQMPEDRRATVSRYDGHYNFSLSTAATWISLVVALCVLTGSVYAAARIGVAAAVRAEINAQVESPRSAITRHIESVIHQHEVDICEPRWNEIQNRLRMIETKQAAISVKLDILIESSRRNGG